MSSKRAFITFITSATLTILTLSILIDQFRQILAAVMGVALVGGALFVAAKIIGIGIKDADKH